MSDEVKLCSRCHRQVDPAASDVVRAVKPEYDEFGPKPAGVPSLFHKAHLPPGWRVIPKDPGV